MPQYVILWNWNEQGIKNAKDSVNRLSSFKKEMENAGGKITNALYTFGEYDGLLIVEAPDDETLARILLSARSSKGTFNSKTLKAFTETEAAKILGGLS
jgi:uncharacterized protein with GYD domain